MCVGPLPRPGLEVALALVGRGLSWGWAGIHPARRRHAAWPEQGSRCPSCCREPGLEQSFSGSKASLPVLWARFFPDPRAGPALRVAFPLLLCG